MTTPPRDIIANHLRNHGYKVSPGHIIYIRGKAWKDRFKINECWFVDCKDKHGQTVRISSVHSLTECTPGIDLMPNTDNPKSHFGGFLVAVPKPKQQPNELDFKTWKHNRASQLGVKISAFENRLWRGKEPLPKMRRINGRRMFVEVA